MTVASIFNEPLDWLMTANEIRKDPWSPWSYAGLIPFVPSAAGKAAKSIDNIVDVAKTIDNTGDIARSVAGPTGAFYSTAFETRLSPTSYPGVTRYMHFKEANTALDAAMESNPALRELGISVPRSPTGSILGKSPRIGSGIMLKKQELCNSFRRASTQIFLEVYFGKQCIQWGRRIFKVGEIIKL